jgi:hypothetical protein
VGLAISVGRDEGDEVLIEFKNLMYLTADFSVIDPQRMMCTYGPAEGSTPSFVHAWLVWVNINAIRCDTTQRATRRDSGQPRAKKTAYLS